MKEENTFVENSPAVQAHLTITQSIIQRMASNSTSCKAWCITLVSAILVVVASKDNPGYALIALIPAVLFLVLDAYYLALEKEVRKAYNDFIDKLHRGKVVASDLYVVSPKGKLYKTFFMALISFSVWPFYLTLIGMIWLAKWLLLK